MTWKILSDKAAAGGNKPRCARGIASAGLLLCGLAIIVFLPSVSPEPLWDDPHYVFENPPVGDRARGLARIWAGEFLMDYYPVAQTAIWIEYGFLGNDPLGFRLTNIIWHAIGACIIWQAARAWRLPAAWWLAALWAVHPAHVDAVAWISQHKSTVGAIFFAVAAWAYARHLRANDIDSGERRSFFWYPLALACHAGACLSKTDAVMLPPLLTILEAWWWPLTAGHSPPLTARLPAIVRRQLPFYGVSAATALVAIKFMRERTLRGSLELGPPLERMLDACWAICFYVADVFWPANLAAAYPVGDIPAGDAISWIWPGLIVAALTVAWAARRCDSGTTLAAVSAFIVLLVPVLFIVPQGFFQYSLVADRYLHLPLLAPAAVVAAGLPFLNRRGRQTGRGPIGWLTGGLLIVILALGTWRHAFHYRNERALWQAALAAQPRAWFPHFGLGAHLLWDRHDPTTAIPFLVESCRRRPDFAKGQFVTGIALTPTQPAEARRHLADAIALRPDHAMAWLALGECCLRMNDQNAAAEVYARTARWAQTAGRARTELVRLALVGENLEAVVAARRHLEQTSLELAASRRAGLAGVEGDEFEQALALAMLEIFQTGEGVGSLAGFERLLGSARDAARSSSELFRVEAWTNALAETAMKLGSGAAGENRRAAIAAAAAGHLAQLRAELPHERTVAQELAIARRIAGDRNIKN